MNANSHNAYIHAGSQIRELLLAYNNMTGIIPNVTSLNSQLDAMDLTFNQISGKNSARH